MRPLTRFVHERTLSGINWVLDNTADIRQTRPNTVSLPQHFKQHGYWTGGVGKLFHTPKHDPGKLPGISIYDSTMMSCPMSVQLVKFEADHGSVETGPNRRRWRTLKKQVSAKLSGKSPPGHGPSGLTDAQHKDGKNADKSLWLLKGVWRSAILDRLRYPENVMPFGLTSISISIR